MHYACREVGQQVAALALALAARVGLAKGDRVGVYGVNSPEWIKAMVVSAS